jgi:hypothetical protein
LTIGFEGGLARPGEDPIFGEPVVEFPAFSAEMIAVLSRSRSILTIMAKTRAGCAGDAF